MPRQDESRIGRLTLGTQIEINFNLDEVDPTPLIEYLVEAITSNGLSPVSNLSTTPSTPKATTTAKPSKKKRASPTKISQQTAQKIVDHIVAATLSQAEIAKLTKVDRQAVYNVSSGRTYRHLSGFTPFPERTIKGTETTDPVYYNRTPTGQPNKVGRAYIAKFTQLRARNTK